MPNAREEHLKRLIAEIRHTDEVRQRRPSPLDEAKWGFGTSVVKANENDYDSATPPRELSMLTLIERRSEIVRLTETRGKVNVGELVRQLQVSAVTIRNDLNALSKKGLVVRSRGGAIASTRLARELSVQEKYKENLPIKRRLGKAVADLIDEEVRSILFDSGTTTEEVALCLVGRSNLTVMTNGLNVASALASAEGIDLLVTGGMLRKKSMSFYGRQAEESLRFFHFDRLILGTDGIDTKVGVTTHFEPEASLNRVMRSVATQVILVADSSKFGKRGPHVICRHTDIDMLVTDNGIAADTLKTLLDAGVDVRVVSDPP